MSLLVAKFYDADQNDHVVWGMKCVFARSNAGIFGSNPTQDMDVRVYVYSVFVSPYM
jgi:hypothetical protein